MGNIKIEETECYLNPIFDEAFKYYNTLRHDDKNQVLCLLVNKEILVDDFMIVTDEIKLTKIIFKLLKCAFDFYNLGVIEFGYTFDELKLYFFLKDSRDTILHKTSKEILSLQEFDEIKSAKTNHFDLSLTIASQLIKQMHGRIWVENQKEKGYSIKFELPIKIPGITRNYKLDQTTYKIIN